MNKDMIILVIFGLGVSLIGTMLGATLGVMVKKPSRKFLSSIIGFSGGIMLSIVVFELMPEAMEKLNFTKTLIYCLLGISTIAIIDNLWNAKGDYSENNFTQNSHFKVALMTALALMIHNLPEGIIMGCGFMSAGSLGVKMSIIIAIHDMPEGMAVSAPLMASRIKISKIFMYAFFTALPTAVGVLLGVWLGNISSNMLGASLAYASGIMLYVVCGEMIPESTKLWDGTIRTIGILIGILLGFTMSVLL